MGWMVTLYGNTCREHQERKRNRLFHPFTKYFTAAKQCNAKACFSIQRMVHIHQVSPQNKQGDKTHRMKVKKFHKHSR